MKLLLALALILQFFPMHAAPSAPVHHRSAVTMPRQAAARPANHTWKLGLLGLAGLSFLIRKRL